MKLIVAKTYDDMSELAGDILLTYMVMEKPQNISITGGRTPALMYEKLIPKVNSLNLKHRSTFYNFDEIPYNKTVREGVTITDVRNYFLTPANIPEENIHVLDQHNYKQQDQLIRERGGMDLMIIGIGADGHYCGNLPNTTKFFEETSKVIMPEDMRLRVGKGHFNDPAEYPDYYITMGPRSVMNTGNIVLIANGKEKAAIIKRILQGPVTDDIPSSILPMHPNLTIIVDADAASELDQETINKYK